MRVGSSESKRNLAPAPAFDGGDLAGVLAPELRGRRVNYFPAGVVAAALVDRHAVKVLLEVGRLRVAGGVARIAAVS